MAKMITGAGIQFAEDMVDVLIAAERARAAGDASELGLLEVKSAVIVRDAAEAGYEPVDILREAWERKAAQMKPLTARQRYEVAVGEYRQADTAYSRASMQVGTPLSVLDKLSDRCDAARKELNDAFAAMKAAGE